MEELELNSGLFLNPTSFPYMISLDTAVKKKIAVIDQPILLAPRIAHLLRRCPLHTYLLCICDVGEGGAVNQSWEHAEGQEEVEGG